MLNKSTFVSLMNIAHAQEHGMVNLEETLHVTFDNCFLSDVLDGLLCTIAKSFFTEEQINNIEDQTTIETVTDILYHFALTCEFGKKSDRLKRLYVEDDGLESERAFDALNEEQLYDLIVRYIAPPEVCQTYTLHC